MHYSERRESNITSVTSTVDAMIKGGHPNLKLACTIVYKAYISLYRNELDEPVSLHEAVEFVNDRIVAFKDSGLASYEDLGRLVTSYGDLTDQNRELIKDQQGLIDKYEELVARQNAALTSLRSIAGRLAS